MWVSGCGVDILSIGGGEAKWAALVDKVETSVLRMLAVRRGSERGWNKNPYSSNQVGIWVVGCGTEGCCGSWALRPR